MTWQLDLVEQQLCIAAGEPLSDAVLGAGPRGHALEARVYAEDPARGYLPQPGRVERFLPPPETADLRVDAGISEGYEVTPHYDPLLAKLTAWGATREEARVRLERGLAETELVLVGPKGPRATNLGLLRRVLAHPEFRNGEYDTHLLERL
jgi:acetyl/propionyl-CoA carboxylase alpha subunit